MSSNILTVNVYYVDHWLQTKNIPNSEKPLLCTFSPPPNTNWNYLIWFITKECRKSQILPPLTPATEGRPLAVRKDGFDPKLLQYALWAPAEKNQKSESSRKPIIIGIGGTFENLVANDDNIVHITAINPILNGSPRPAVFLKDGSPTWFWPSGPIPPWSMRFWLWLQSLVPKSWKLSTDESSEETKKSTPESDPGPSTAGESLDSTSESLQDQHHHRNHWYSWFNVFSLLKMILLGARKTNNSSSRAVDKIQDSNSFFPASIDLVMTALLADTSVSNLEVESRRRRGWLELGDNEDEAEEEEACSSVDSMIEIKKQKEE